MRPVHMAGSRYTVPCIRQSAQRLPNPRRSRPPPLRSDRPRHSEHRVRRSCITKFATNLHQDLSQHVLPAAVVAVTPIAVVLGVLDEFGIASAEKYRSKFFMLGELGSHRFEHYGVLDRLPVGTELL